MALVDAGNLAPLLTIFSIFGVQILTLAVHELAHALVAAGYGLFPITTMLGTGDVFIDISLQKVRVVLKRWPFGGMVVPSGQVGGRYSVARGIALIAAGPVADLSMLACSVWLLVWPPDWWASLDFSKQVDPVLGITTIWLVLGHVVGFKPRTVTMEGNAIPNDTLQIWQLIRYRSRYKKLYGLNDELLFHADAGNEKSLERVKTSFALALNACNALEEKNSVRDWFASYVLFLDLPDLLELADRASADLVASSPDTWTYKGTRAAVLIDSGRIEEGMILGKEVAQQSPAAHDKSITMAFLAIGEARLGRTEEAQRWMEQAVAIDPNCVGVKRAQKEMIKISGRGAEADHGK